MLSFEDMGMLSGPVGTGLRLSASYGRELRTSTGSQSVCLAKLTTVGVLRLLRLTREMREID